MHMTPVKHNLPRSVAPVSFSPPSLHLLRGADARLFSVRLICKSNRGSLRGSADTSANVSKSITSARTGEGGEKEEVMCGVRFKGECGCDSLSGVRRRGRKRQRLRKDSDNLTEGERTSVANFDGSTIRRSFISWKNLLEIRFFRPNICIEKRKLDRRDRSKYRVNNRLSIASI